jgi:hypothetical protein
MVMTGLVAEQFTLTDRIMRLCSARCGDIELGAVRDCCSDVQLGGTGLAVVRLPAALFGAATVLPFYGRALWAGKNCGYFGSEHHG